MIEQTISSETARLAKEKGFHLKPPCDCGPEGCICELVEKTLGDDYLYHCNQSLLQKWLREVHIDCNDGENITLISSLTDVTPYKFTVYEDALETGLYKALELIKLPA